MNFTVKIAASRSFQGVLLVFLIEGPQVAICQRIICFTVWIGCTHARELQITESKTI